MAEPFLRPYTPKDDLYLFRLGRKVSEAGVWSDSKLQILAQPYYGQVKTAAEPYGALASDLLKTAINLQEIVRENIARIVDEKYPVVVDSVSQCASFQTFTFFAHHNFIRRLSC